MNADSMFWLARVIAVVGLLGFSAFLASPKGRLPLALRGVARLMRQDRGEAISRTPADSGTPASKTRRFFALVCMIIAIILAVI